MAQNTPFKLLSLCDVIADSLLGYDLSSLACSLHVTYNGSLFIKLLCDINADSLLSYSLSVATNLHVHTTVQGGASLVPRPHPRGEGLVTSG